VYQYMHPVLIHRFREQARSHRGWRMAWECITPATYAAFLQVA
jgi:hypothetical protein